MCYELQQYCQNTNRAYHYIDSPDELILRRPYLELQSDNTGVIKQGCTGPVYRFLSEDNQHNQKRILIVNFAKFSTNELTRYNSLLDEEPNIDGVPLPKEIKVIGLIDTRDYKDASFYSRFGSAVEICPVEASKFIVSSLWAPLQSGATAAAAAAETTTDSALEIDFYGASNWKTRLLGTWSLQETALKFIPGKLAKQILDLQNKLVKLRELL